MKTYEEMAENVFRRRDEYKAIVKKRNKRIAKIMALLVCCSAVVISCVVYYDFSVPVKLPSITHKLGDGQKDSNTIAASNSGNEVSDNSSKQEDMSKFGEYSEALVDLENKIRNAIKKNEFPYVISYTMCDDPEEKLNVVVTTKDEYLINKLAALDETGKLMEIEYEKTEKITYLTTTIQSATGSKS